MKSAEVATVEYPFISEKGAVSPSTAISLALCAAQTTTAAEGQESSMAATEAPSRGSAKAPLSLTTSPKGDIVSGTPRAASGSHESLQCVGQHEMLADDSDQKVPPGELTVRLDDVDHCFEHVSLVDDFSIPSSPAASVASDLSVLTSAEESGEAEKKTSLALFERKNFLPTARLGLNPPQRCQSPDLFPARSNTTTHRTANAPASAAGSPTANTGYGAKGPTTIWNLPLYVDSPPTSGSASPLFYGSPLKGPTGGLRRGAGHTGSPTIQRRMAASHEVTASGLGGSPSWRVPCRSPPPSGGFPLSPAAADGSFLHSTYPPAKESRQHNPARNLTPVLRATEENSPLRPALLRSNSGKERRADVDTPVQGEAKFVDSNDVDLELSTECLNFEDAENVCQEKELEKDHIDGLHIVPLPTTVGGIKGPEFVLYALYFSSGHGSPTLPGDDSIKLLFPQELQHPSPAKPKQKPKGRALLSCRTTVKASKPLQHVCPPNGAYKPT